MSSPARSDRRDARRNRAAVIDGALALLAEDPDASMERIAARSGVGRTTVYRHFENRDSLLAALFERVVEAANEATSEVIARGEPVERTLRELGPAIIGISQRYRFLASARNLGLPVIERSTTEPTQPLRAFIQDAQERGEIRPEAPAQWLLSAINGLSLAAASEVRAGRMDPAEAGRQLGEMLDAALVPSPAPAPVAGGT